MDLDNQQYRIWTRLYGEHGAMYMDAKNKNECGNRVGILGGRFGVEGKIQNEGNERGADHKVKIRRPHELEGGSHRISGSQSRFSSRIQTQDRRASCSRSRSGWACSVSATGSVSRMIADLTKVDVRTASSVQIKEWTCALNACILHPLPTAVTVSRARRNKCR